MPILLENVNYTYMPGTPYARTALNNIRLTIEKGQFTAIIGRTGSGKSTLIQQMAGLLQPDTGKVVIDNVEINTKTAAAKKALQKVGIVFQFPEQQIFAETVYQDIAFGPRNLKLAENEVEARVKSAMQFTGLDFNELAARSLFQLSGGQMRRVAIAGVIALQPEYLILDEPAAGLDPQGGKEIFSQITKLFKAQNMAVILISHNMDDVARMADRVIVMQDGGVYQDGSPQAIFAGQYKEIIAAGIGLPEITELLNALSSRGLAVNNRVFTPEQAVEEIIAALREKKLCGKI